MADVRHDGTWAIKLPLRARRNDQQDCKLTFSSAEGLRVANAQ